MKYSTVCICLGKSRLHVKAKNDDVTMCPRPMCPETKSLGLCVPLTMCPVDDASMDVTSLGRCVPNRCVLTLNRIRVLVKKSQTDSPIYILV